MSIFSSGLVASGLRNSMVKQGLDNSYVKNELQSGGLVNAGLNDSMVKQGLNDSMIHRSLNDSLTRSGSPNRLFESNTLLDSNSTRQRRSPINSNALRTVLGTVLREAMSYRYGSQQNQDISGMRSFLSPFGELVK